MTDRTANHSKSSKPLSPAFKGVAGAKLVPLPAPIPQSNDKEPFPVFLGAGIAISMLALITVFILSFTSTKKKMHPAPLPGARRFHDGRRPMMPPLCARKNFANTLATIPASE